MYEYYGEQEWKELGPELIRKLSMACVFDLITPSELLGLLEEEEYEFIMNNENAIRRQYSDTGVFYEMVHALRVSPEDITEFDYDSSLSFCQAYEKLVKQCKACI